MSRLATDKTLILIAWMLMISLAFLSAQQQLDPPLKEIYYGYYGPAFSNVDKNDAQASIQILMRQIAQYWKNKIKTKAFVYENEREVKSAILSKKINILVVPSLAYLKWHKKWHLEPGGVGIRNHKVGLSYLLVINKNNPWTKGSDLLHKRLIIHDNKLEGSLPLLWLKTRLMEEGIPLSELKFKVLKNYSRPSKVLLPVFFQKADACIITEDAFKTLNELNPQLGKQLKILKKSPTFLETLMCLTRPFAPRAKKFLLDTITGISKYPQGRQILTIFRTDRVIRYQKKYLTTVMDLLHTYQNLSKRLK